MEDAGQVRINELGAEIDGVRDAMRANVAAGDLEMAVESVARVARA